MLKCIIFDLDGTLGNTLPLCIAAFKKSIEPFAGRVLTDQEIIDTFGPSEEGTIQALIPDHYDKGVESYLKHYQELHSMCAAPFEGIPEILEFAKQQGIRLAMVTGKGEHSAMITLKHFGIENYFEVIEAGSPHGPRKVEGIQNVIKRFNVKPEECVYVGDVPSDIESSRAAGVPIVSAAWAETAEWEKLQELKPDQLFKSVEQFKQYIAQSIS